jgi:hypothetical protein
MTFPFDAVYDFFAHPIIESYSGKGLIRPSVICAFVHEAMVVHTEFMPERLMDFYFGTETGKDALARMQKATLSVLPKGRSCIVVIAETYVRKLEDGEAYDSQPLKDDPKAHEAVVITIRTHDKLRFGQMPILADRRIEYQPLIPEAFAVMEGSEIPEWFGETRH